MFYDEIVEEVRKNRQTHAAKFDYDLQKIAKDLNSKQISRNRKLVSYPPKVPKLRQKLEQALG